VVKGAKAPEAAGVIHTDFIRGFIRAEVCPWEEFVKLGGWVHVKEKGLMRLEGKDYEIKDGDTVYFHVNT
jgi:ribosome-binding ATPase YchF (GTP1/OBG family)